MEVVLGEEVEVDGMDVEAEVEAETEQEEADVLSVETSSKEDAAGLVQDVPFPTIYRTRTRTNLHRNPAKGWQTPLSNNTRERTIIHGRGSSRLR
jgi:hypothetical protein